MSEKVTKYYDPTVKMTRIKLRIPEPVAEWLRDRHGSISLGVTILCESAIGKELTIKTFGKDQVGANRPERPVRQVGRVYTPGMRFTDGTVRVPQAVADYLAESYPSRNLGVVKLYEAETGQTLTA